MADNLIKATRQNNKFNVTRRFLSCARDGERICLNTHKFYGVSLWICRCSNCEHVSLHRRLAMVSSFSLLSGNCSGNATRVMAKRSNPVMRFTGSNLPSNCLGRVKDNWFDFVRVMQENLNWASWICLKIFGSASSCFKYSSYFNVILKFSRDTWNRRFCFSTFIFIH